MSKKLDFNEIDLLNATWSGMKALQGKQKKDAGDLNALSKGTSSITKFLQTKLAYTKYVDKNPRTLGRSTLFLT